MRTKFIPDWSRLGYTTTAFGVMGQQERKRDGGFGGNVIFYVNRNLNEIEARLE